jgi:membrane protease YdiL (CAAX protease family)
MNFPGTYFLIPIILFTILILTFKKIKSNISWWTKDKIDTTSVLLIIGLSLVSGLLLFIWGKYIAKDLSKFTGILPDVTLVWIIINGIGFALLNSIAEEYLSRGMLCNGLEKIFSNKWLIITIQAIVFSIFHYHGFPGGLIGMTMVFVWSVVLGILRYRTKGLAGVLIGHFIADLTIFFILYGLK